MTKRTNRDRRYTNALVVCNGNTDAHINSVTKQKFTFLNYNAENLLQ